MTLFEDRERAAEHKFEQDQELAFRIIARRNRLLGLWAAAQLGLAGQRAEQYALDIVDAEVTAYGETAVVRRVCGDFRANGFPMTEAEVRRHLTTFAARARDEVTRGID